MDPKLAILFILISVVLWLSYLGGQNRDRLRHQFINRRWRKFVPLRRKS